MGTQRVMEKSFILSHFTPEEMCVCRNAVFDGSKDNSAPNSPVIVIDNPISYT